MFPLAPKIYSFVSFPMLTLQDLISVIHLGNLFILSFFLPKIYNFLLLATMQPDCHVAEVTALVSLFTEQTLTIFFLPIRYSAGLHLESGESRLHAPTGDVQIKQKIELLQGNFQIQPLFRF